MFASVTVVKKKKVINFIYNSLFQEGRNRLINTIDRRNFSSLPQS